MRPKYFNRTLGILVLVFIGIYFLVTRTTIFDFWMLNKLQPRLCLQEEKDGEKVFAFCDLEGSTAAVNAANEPIE